MAEGEMNEASFRRMVLVHYKQHGRHSLPWRPTSREATKGKKNQDPYRILVSEVMLQQTQVERVIPFYKNFIKQFPNVKALAQAPLADVLKAWQGLGYNRRAKMLHLAAKKLTCSRSDLEHELESTGDVVVQLETLPGVGHYTARAVAAFAYNEDVILIETNIRTAIIHYFFSRRSDVADTELVEVLKRLLPSGRSREWYSALMDYGAHLKKSGVKLNTKSKHYTKQSKFTGSIREARGAILRELSVKNMSESTLIGLCGQKRRPQMRVALRDLLAEGLVETDSKNYSLAH